MKTLCAIESFTGGLFASTIINRKGASIFFKGSLVSYNNSIKEKLGVDISKGVMNKKMAFNLTQAGRSFFNADICVAFTGNAGPTALENLNPGDVFIAINNKVYFLHFEGSRNEVRKKAVAFALNKIGDI